MTVGRRGKFNFDLLPGSRKKSEKTWHAAEGLVTLFSIEKNLRTLTSLDTVCPQCQAIIEPPQIERLNSRDVKCPYCDAIFTPQKKRDQE